MKAGRIWPALLYARLIQKDKVDLVFSPYGTPLTLAASQVSESHKKVMLTCGASGEKVWSRGHRYVFGVYAPARRYFIGLLDLMARAGHKRVSLVYDQTSSFNQDVIEGAGKWARRFQLEIVFEKGYANGGTGDIAALVPQIMEADASGLLLSAYSPDCYRFLELLERHEYRPPVLGMTIAPVHPQFGKKAGKSAEKVFAPSQWEADERIPFPGTKRFIAAFMAFTGQRPSYHAGSAYAACQLYEQAVFAVNSLDNDKIRDYIATLDTVTVIGRFKVDATRKANRAQPHHHSMAKRKKRNRVALQNADRQTAFLKPAKKAPVCMRPKEGVVFPRPKTRFGQGAGKNGPEPVESKRR